MSLYGAYRQENAAGIGRWTESRARFGVSKLLRRRFDDSARFWRRESRPESSSRILAESLTLTTPIEAKTHELSLQYYRHRTLT